MLYIVILGLAVLALTYIVLCKHLVSKVKATEKEYGSLFNEVDLKNLKSVLLPTAGALFGFYFLSFTFTYCSLLEYSVVLAIEIAIYIACYVAYLKAVRLSIENFNENGKKLITAVKTISYGSSILSGLFVLVLLKAAMDGMFRNAVAVIPLLALALMVTTQIPTFKAVQMLIKEIKRALASPEIQTPTQPANAKTENTESNINSVTPTSTSQPTKRCPYCGEEILAVAKKCKHCGEWLNK